MGAKQDFAKDVVGQINSNEVMGLIQQSVKQNPSLTGQDGSSILAGCQKLNELVGKIPIIGAPLDKLKELIAPAVPTLSTIVGGTVNVAGQVASIAAPIAGAVIGGLAGAKIEGADKGLATDLGKLGGAAGGGVIGGLTTSLSQAAADLTTGLLQPSQKRVNASDLVGVVSENASVNGKGRVDMRQVEDLSSNLVGLLRNVDIKPEQIQSFFEKSMQKPKGMDPGDAALSVEAKPFTPQAQKQSEARASSTAAPSALTPDERAPTVSKPGKP